MKIIVEINPGCTKYCGGCTCLNFKYPQGEGNVVVTCKAFGKILDIPEQFDRPLRHKDCLSSEEEYNRLFEIASAACDFTITPEGN